MFALIALVSLTVYKQGRQYVPKERRARAYLGDRVAPGVDLPGFLPLLLARFKRLIASMSAERLAAWSHVHARTS